MATLKSLLQETVRAGAQSSVRNYGTPIEIQVTGTGWTDYTDYYPPANGVIQMLCYFASEAWLTTDGNDHHAWVRTRDAEYCCSLCIPVRKGQDVGMWRELGTKESSKVSTVFIPFA